MNTLNIKPNIVNKIYTYHVGVYKKDNDNNLIEVSKAISGTKIEDYFPLVIENLNKRGNWKYIDSKEALDTHHIDYCWTNATQIDMKSSIHSRFMIDSVNNYISNKKEFYTKFQNYSFVPVFLAFTKKNIRDIKITIKTLFANMPVIIKPDNGSCGIGILLQKSLKFKKIVKHIDNFDFDGWTISEAIIGKQYDNYIVTNRVYFMVVKSNNSEINSYYYTDFMNYRANDKFTGDIQDARQMITNFYDHQFEEEHFIRNRFVPFNKWKGMFTDSEFKSIEIKIDSIFGIITDHIKNDLLASNDNKEGNRQSYHIYGADIIIDNNLNVRVLELNGAPAMNIKTRLYNVKDRIDYFDVINDALELTVDKLYPPLNTEKRNNKFRLIYSDDLKHDQKYNYYICNSIVKSYPFIYDAIDKRNYIKRTRNMFDNIDFFYGLRERYITNDTSLNFYDELLNYNNSKLMRNGSIINKIQGVTYYMANKGRIYEKLKDRYANYDEFHPLSYVFIYKSELSSKKQIHNLISENKSIKNWIIKPVHGSRGYGIKIFSRKTKFFSLINEDNKLTDEIVDHIKKCAIEGVTYKLNKNNGMNGEITNEYITQKYNYWIISKYLDKPHLLEGKKYNIRFYVVLTINGKLLRYEDIFNNNEYDKIDAYVFNDALIYKSLLEYNGKTVPHEYKDLDENMISKLRNLTNLEIISEIKEKLPNIDADLLRKTSTGTLHNLFEDNPEFIKNVKLQGHTIIRKVINSIKYDMRSLNRFSNNYKGSFNLLAFDTMLDSDKNLWFIEVNRGPDMKAMELNYGYDTCVDIFDEIFKITLDKHLDTKYIEKPYKYFTKYPIKQSVLR